MIPNVCEVVLYKKGEKKEKVISWQALMILHLLWFVVAVAGLPIFYQIFPVQMSENTVGLLYGIDNNEN